MSKSVNLLQEQIEYYRQRASEYQVFFVDSLFVGVASPTENRTSPAINHATLHQDGYSERKLNDGRVYQVVKIFHDRAQLEKSLQNLGWYGQIHATPTHFIYGSIHRIDEPQSPS